MSLPRQPPAPGCHSKSLPTLTAPAPGCHSLSVHTLAAPCTRLPLPVCPYLGSPLHQVATPCLSLSWQPPAPGCHSLSVLTLAAPCTRLPLPVSPYPGRRPNPGSPLHQVATPCLSLPWQPPAPGCHSLSVLTLAAPCTRLPLHVCPYLGSPLHQVATPSLSLP